MTASSETVKVTAYCASQCNGSYLNFLEVSANHQ